MLDHWGAPGVAAVVQQLEIAVGDGHLQCAEPLQSSAAPQDRAGVLAQLEAPPLVLHVAESEHKKFTFEVCGSQFACCFLAFAKLRARHV